MKNVNQLLVITGVVCVLFYSKTVFSQFNNFHKNYIDIGIVGGNQHHHSSLLGVYAGFGTFFYLFNKPSSIDIRAKELYISNPEQQGTLLTFTYRMSLIKGFYIGVGAAHGHQVKMNEFLIHPTSAIGGINKHILHTSGFNLETGYHFNSLLKNKSYGIYPLVNFAYTQLYSTTHHIPNLMVSIGLKLGFKKMI